MTSPDPHIGLELDGGFRIVERIGAGGMGAVYKAEQAEMNRYVAVKILHAKYASRSDLAARFRREARAMSHLSHPNTARVFLYSQLPDGSCYIVMEYLEGMNLAKYVRVNGPVPWRRALPIMVQVCGALEEAHRAGIIHRDLKPENVFLTTPGGLADFPKVLDFGLAKVTEREMRPGSLILTQEGMVFGTPEFMSPEQAQGRTLDARADIYSLGVILYEMLTGKLPFDAKRPMDYVHLHINGKPISLAERHPTGEFPALLQVLFDSLLAKRPEDRPQSASDFAARLVSVLDGSASFAGAMPAAFAVNEGSAIARNAQTVPDDPRFGTGAGGVSSNTQNGAPVVLPTSRAPWIVAGVAIVVALGLAVTLFVR